MKVLIVGGVAGGASAAARLRRLDESAQIIIFERSSFVSYANCGLPYYIGGVIEDESELSLQAPESLWKRFRIDARTRQEVCAVDPAGKTVTVCRLDSGELYQESYDKLILSPGAKPVKPDMPGINSEKLFTLRTVEDTLRMRRYIDSRKPGSALLVGGGYIGLELAENLRERGLRVTIVQQPDQLMNTLDYDMATLVHAKLRQNGVELRLNSNVTGFEDSEDGIKAFLGSGESISADMVLLAIGVSPDNSLALSAGLELGIKGSIVVNDRMESSVPDIYAVGDAVQIKNPVSGQDALISLAGPANKQGRIAADNICGIDSHYAGTMGSSVIKIFDMTVASTGLSEKAARAAGLEIDRVVLSPSSHASYYPGAKNMTVKIIYEKGSLKLLGAQIIGYEGVDKRLDIISAAMSGALKADRLKELELAYAPPYSSAKDPVNMAGFIIDNIENARLGQFHWDELPGISNDGSVIRLDVRTRAEYELSHIEGFINIPLDDLRERLSELERGKPVYVICQSGIRSYIACRVLAQNGFECYNFSGGYGFYRAVSEERLCGESGYPCGMEK